MRKNTVFMYIAVTLAVMLSVPGRLGYGMVMVVAINFLMLVATAAGKLLDFMRLDTLRPVCVLVLLVCASVLFKQLLILYSPLCALTMGFALYMPVTAVLMIGDCFDNADISLGEALRLNMRESALFSLFALFFFLAREIAGYGTVSVPVPSGLARLALPQVMAESPGTFWATIPGGIVLAGLLLAGISLVRRKFAIISRSDELKEECRAD